MRYARLGLVAISLAALGVVLTPRASAQKSPAAEKSNMELVGCNDLQGRSAYQPSSRSRAIAGSPTSVTTAAAC